MPTSTITNTPRNQLLGLLADAVMPVANSGLLGEFMLGKAGNVLNDLSYGGSVTTGRGMTTGVKPDAVDLLNLLPVAGLAKPAAKMAGRELARQYQTGTGLGRYMVGPRQEIFIGEKAKTWDVSKANQYKDLVSKGVSDKDAYFQTGTFKGADGKLRQEIDDSSAIFNNAEALQVMAQQKKDEIGQLKDLIKPNKSQPDLFPKQLTEARKPTKQKIEQLKNDIEGNFGLLANPMYTGNLAKFSLKNKNLYDAYPDLGDFTITQSRPSSQSGLLGGYDNYRTIDVTRAGMQENPRSTLIHELQHAVQETENFGRGGNPITFEREIEDAQAEVKSINRSLDEIAKMLERSKGNNWIDPETGLSEKTIRNSYDELMQRKKELIPIFTQDPYKSYQNLAGEVESRLTQQRLDMTMPERLKSYPPEQMMKMGFPIENQLVRGLLGD